MSDNMLKIFFTFGKLFSFIYSAVMRLRAVLYSRGVLSSVKLSVPVVSIGNLTMGGTGKTPVVKYVAQLLQKKYRPAILSRGYGGKSKAPVNIVSDGENVLLDANVAGDEPVLLAQSLPGVPVVTGAKRSATGRYVEANGLAGLIVMDDGFQHLSVKRDLNLVLFAAGELLGDGWVFPGGILREPICALNRADAFVATGVTAHNRDTVIRFRDSLRSQFANRPFFDVEYRIETFTLQSDASRKYPVAHLHGKKLFAFCGIAKPESFYSMIDDEGIQLAHAKSFADHYRYTLNDLESLSVQARSLGCDGLLTTEKDFVKIKDMPITLPVWVAELTLVASDDFDQFVLDKVEALPVKR